MQWQTPHSMRPKTSESLKINSVYCDVWVLVLPLRRYKHIWLPSFPAWMVSRRSTSRCIRNIRQPEVTSQEALSWVKVRQAWCLATLWGPFAASKSILSAFLSISATSPSSTAPIWKKENNLMYETFRISCNTQFFYAVQSRIKQEFCKISSICWQLLYKKQNKAMPLVSKYLPFQFVYSTVKHLATQVHKQMTTFPTMQATSILMFPNFLSETYSTATQ